MYSRTYSDDQLIAAVAGASSWRGVLRELGLRATSAGSLRSVQRHAARLELSHAHFTGQRRWSDARLHAAVDTAHSWQEVARSLELSPHGSTVGTLRAHAVRLGLDVDHLSRARPSPPSPILGTEFDPAFLRSAGSLFAATWFTLHRRQISWPLEPCRYDILVDLDGELQRVQVKTTTGTGPDALVLLSNSRRRGRHTYVPGEIDSFFIVDGELSAYLIPYQTVAGLGTLKLSHYVNFKVVDRGDLLSEPASPGP